MEQISFASVFQQSLTVGLRVRAGNLLPPWSYNPLKINGNM